MALEENPFKTNTPNDILRRRINFCLSCFFEIQSKLQHKKISSNFFHNKHFTIKYNSNVILKYYSISAMKNL